MSGTVNIARAIFDHAIFADEPKTEREAWIWLVVEASWKPREKRVGKVIVKTQRGQLATSIRFLAGAWKWTAPKVQRYLKRLEKASMIVTSADTGVSVLTICNYDEYQSGGKASDTAPIQKRYSSDTNDKKDERREEGKEQDATASLPAVPDHQPIDEVAEAVHAYKATAAQKGWPIPQQLDQTRRRAISGRIRDAGGVDGWRIAIEKAAGSEFLGQARPFSGFGIDWIAKPANFKKIMEGNYDGQPSARVNHHAASRSDALRDTLDVAGRMRRTSEPDWLRG